MASYSCTTKYQNSSGGDWVELKLDWSYTNTATQATISATLYVRRDGYGPTQGDASYWVKINGTDIFNTSTSNLTVGSSWVTVKSGSKTINLTNSGASATSLTMTAYYNQPISSKLAGLRINKSNYSGSYWNTSYATQSGSLTATIPAQTSACSAPTSVTASGIITPNGSFTVSWSGAKSGTNNSISSYQVYYRITSGGSAPTTSTYTGTVNVSTTATSGSKTITVSGATRGHIVVCGVVTRGSAGSNYYSSIKTGGSVRINDLPAKPTLNKSSQTIPSTSSGLSVTATVGSDSYSTSTPIVKHNTSNSHTGQENFTTGTLGVGTHYFWTYDGLEYSSVTTITITRNTKPTLSNAGYSSTTTYTAKGISTYVYQATPKATCSKSSGTYYLQWRYKKSTDSDSSYEAWEDVANASFSSKDFTCGNRVLDVLLIGKKKNLNTEYDWNVQFRIRVKDDYEYSDWINCNALTYAGALTYNGSVPTEKIATTFTATINNDERLNNWSVLVEQNGLPITSTITSNTVSNNIRTLNITIANLSSGGEITCTVTGTRTSPEITKTVSFDRIVRIKTEILSLSFDNYNLDPFDNSSSGIISLSGTWGNDFESGNSYDFSIIAYKGSYAKTVKTVSVNYIAETGYSNNTSQFSISDLFTDYSNIRSDNNLGIIYSNYVGDQSYQLKCSIINRFGETITFSPTTLYYITFDKVATITTSTNPIQYKKDGEWHNFTNNRYIQEGLGLKFKYTISNYCYKNIQLTLQVATNSDFSDAREAGSKVVEISNAMTATGWNVPTLISGEIYYGNIQSDSTDRTLGEITNSLIRYWRIVAQQFTSNEYTGSLTTNVLRSTYPSNFGLNSIVQDATNSLQYNVNYSLSDSGIDVISNLTQKQLILQYSVDGGNEWNNISVITNNYSETGGPITFTKTSPPIESSYPFRLVIITQTIDGSYLSNTKSAISNSIVVYTDQPTVSYRKNYLGINNKSPEDDAFLDAITAQGREKLYIRKAGSSTFVLNFPYVEQGGNPVPVISLDII